MKREIALLAQSFLIAILATSFLTGCHRNNSSQMKPIDDEAIQEMSGYIDRDVAAGFLSAEEIVESVVELLSGDYDSEALKPLAVAHTRESLAQHLLRQQEWPEVTDCDRLDAAFTQLEQAGIVCRQNFSCCGTCGAGEIWDEIESARSQGVQVRGYAFYHMQDTEGAVDGHGLYLGYGATEEGEQAALQVANQIADALRQRQLQVEWDGTWEKRIGVKLDWKKRRLKRKQPSPHIQP